jgi:hypothetical protein
VVFLKLPARVTKTSVFETGKNMSKMVNVELYLDERDFIIDLLEYALLDELLNKLKKAKPDAENMLLISFDSYDLEQLIGNLSMECNHNKKRSIQEAAYEIAERVESYQSYAT